MGIHLLNVHQKIAKSRRVFVCSLVLVCCVICADLRAQKNSDYEPSLDATYGAFFLQRSYNVNWLSLNATNQPWQYLGVGQHGTFLIGRRMKTVGHTYFSYLLPTNIKLNDTLNVRRNGYLLQFGAIGWAVGKKGGHFFCEMNLGINMGRVKLTGDALSKKNPLVAPKVSVMPRFRFKNCVVGLLCQYQYDVSSNKWKSHKKMDTQSTLVSPLSLTGAMVWLCVGIKLYW